MDILTIQFQNMLQSLFLFIPRLIVAIIIFLVSLYLAGLAARAVTNTLARRKPPVDPELTLLLNRLTRWSIIVIGLIWALNQVNFNVTGFVAGLGIVGFTVGFALKDVAENFVAGMLLLIQQPFDIGDAILVNGYSGTVTDIKIRDTTIRTWDGLLVIIPNATVYTNAITNYTRVERRRINLEVGVSYDTNLEQAHTLLLNAVSSVPGVITDDPAPVVVFKEFGDSSINATVYYWINPAEIGYFDALDAGVKAIKRACDEAGIDIPFPIRTVYMHQVSTGAG